MAAMPVLAEWDLRRLRQQAQLLEPRSSVGVTETVRALAAVQARAPQSAALCLRARTTGLDLSAVEAARVAERAIVRTWTVRGTLHLVPSDDLGWLLALYNPALRASAARRHRELKLTDDDLHAGVHLIRDALATHGPLARRELAEYLATGGIDPSGQRLIQLINQAALEGVLCHGPDCAGDGDSSYVLCADWLGPGWEGAPRERDESLAELALRYVRAYGASTPDDFAAWSGLSMLDAETAWKVLADRLVEVETGDDGAGWVTLGSTADPVTRPVRSTRPAGLSGVDGAGGVERVGGTGDGAAPVVRLLPSSDTYLVGGYRGHEVTVPAEHADVVCTGGDWTKPALTVDGYAVATWHTERQDGRIVVAVHPFRPLDTGVRAGLDAEVADLGRFLGVPTATIVTSPPRQPAAQ